MPPCLVLCSAPLGACLCAKPVPPSSPFFSAPPPPPSPLHGPRKEGLGAALGWLTIPHTKTKERGKGLARRNVPCPACWVLLEWGACVCSSAHVPNGRLSRFFFLFPPRKRGANAHHRRHERVHHQGNPLKEYVCMHSASCTRVQAFGLPLEGGLTPHRLTSPSPFPIFSDGTHTTKHKTTSHLVHSSLQFLLCLVLFFSPSWRMPSINNVFVCSCVRPPSLPFL